MSSKYFQESEEFFHDRKMKYEKSRNENGGNFVTTANGDLVSSISLSKHAQQRLKERPSSRSDALEATKKAGTILSDDGSKVVTVIPESRKKNTGAIQRKNRRPQKNAVHHHHHPSKRTVPDVKTLPKGYCLLSLNLPSNAIGIVLGKQHSNMKKMIGGCSSTKYWYEKDESTMSVWGPEDNVKRLFQDIETVVNNVNHLIGPTIPMEKMPPGCIKRCIFIAESNIGHVTGKGKQNLMKLRNDNPAAAINFNMKTGEMNIWGETTEVNNICNEVLATVQKVKEMRARDNAKREKAGEQSHDRKIRKCEKDLEALRKVQQGTADRKGKLMKKKNFDQKELKRKQKEARAKKKNTTRRKTLQL